ncbi:MAG: hypothetical protein J1E63_02140, partial [Muribaculaceae bacterium]|nr:hypothetical protein [Muribaculaceae bacterium]
SSQYSGYREKYGLLVTQSLTDMQVIDDLCYTHYRPFNLLTEKQKNRLKEHGEEYEDISTWKDVFNAINIVPINSAVIIDNYIFNHFDRRKQSLYSIIKELVPQNLKIPFHLTIFINNENGKVEKQKMEQVIKEIHELKLGATINVSIVAHTIKNETHDRHILTNYHLITSGKGFGVIDYRNVQENTKGEIVSTFHNIEYMPAFTTHKHQHSQLLDWMKDIYVDRKGMNAIYAFEIGDKFENRLLS